MGDRARSRSPEPSGGRLVDDGTGVGCAFMALLLAVEVAKRLVRVFARAGAALWQRVRRSGG